MSNTSSTNPNPYVQAWEEETGNKLIPLTPAESSRGATFSSPGPDTRSEEQKRRDLRAKTEAYNRWLQEDMENKDVAYYKRDGQWKKGNALFFPNENLTQSELAGQQTALISSAIADSFKFLYDHTGKPLINFVDDRTQPAQNQVMGIPGVELVVGTAADAASFIGRKSYEYAVKPTIRNSMILLATPFQLVENVTMFAANLAVVRNNADIQQAEASFLEQLTGIFKNTTMYYETFGRDGVESKGLLPSRELEARRAKFEESLRPTLYGQTATVGRMLGGMGVKFGVIEVGDEWHQFLSGGIDASFNIFGDPANWIPLGWLKGVRMLPESIMAPASARQIKKLTKAGVILTPEVAEKADEVAKLINEANVLSDGGLDLLTAKPNIIYSGDRYTPQTVIEKFIDIEDPQFNAIQDNLIGPGLYGTDASPLGSSYNPNILEHKVDIDGYPNPVPILDETEGANRLYKFEKPDDFVIVDTEVPWTTDANVAWNKTKFEKEFGFDKELYDEIVDAARQSNIEIEPRDVPTFEKLQEAVLGTYYDDPPTLYEYMTRKGNWLTAGEWPYRNRVQTIIPESVYDDFLNNPNLGQYLNQAFQDQRQFDLPGMVDKLRGDYFSGVSLKKYLEINRGSLPTGNIELNKLTDTLVAALDDPANTQFIDEISDVYDTIFKQLDDLFAKTNDAVAAASAVTPNELKNLFGLIDRYGAAVKNAYQNGSEDLGFALNTFLRQFGNNPAEVLSSTLKRDLLSGFGRQKLSLTAPVKKTLADGREIEISVTTSGLSVKSDFGQSAVGQLDSVRAANSQYVFNRWLAANGVDAARYEGGRLWGGYGTHNAFAIFHPSKLKVVDAITGKALPTNVARGMIEAGKDLKVKAEDIAQAQGYRDAVGLVDAWRKSIDPPKYLVWRNSGYAKNLFTAIASQDSASEIWTKILKQRSPRLASKLAKAKTADEVAEIFDTAASSIDPFERLWNLPGWSGNVVSELGYRVKQTINSKSRLAATLPQTGTMPLDDFTAASKYLDDALVITRVPLEQRRALMDELLNIFGQDDLQKIRGDLFDFAGKAKKFVIENRLKPLLDDLAAPLKKTTEEMTVAERLTMNNRRKVVEELRDYINRNSTWTDTGSEITRYSLNDIGTGAKFSWLDGNGSGPLYPSQQNSRGFDILPMDPDELDQFVAYTERWALLREQAKTIPGMFQASQALDTMLRGKYGLFNALTLWKKAMLFTGRYIARVVPEEMTRVQFSGVFSPYEMSYVSEIMSGRLNQNIFGEVFPRVNEAQDLMAELQSAEALQAMIARAATRGDMKQVSKLERKLAQIDQEAIQMRLDQIDDLLESDVASARDIMIGPDIGRAADTILGQSVPGYVKAQTQQVVTLRENPRLWRLFKAQMIIERSVNPAARSVARAMNLGSPAMLEEVAQQMIGVANFGDSALKKAFERYFKQQGKMNPDFNWKSIEGAREYVRTIVDDLTQVTDNHPTMLAAIADGKVAIGDKVIDLGRRTAEGNRPSREFLDLMENGDEGIVGVTPFQKTVDENNFASGYPRVSREKQEQMQGLFNWFMRHAYGRASDKFARVPMFNARKWNLIADMAPMLSKEEAAKLANQIVDYGLPRYVEENVLESLKFAQGKATLKDIDSLAGHQAVEETINLLFDARKRTLFGRNHRLLFPFFDAFREVSAQLMKTAINPLALHKVDKAVRGLENLQVGSPTDAENDGKKQGFIYKDPSTGQMVWNVPATGQAAKALTGIDFGYKITVGSMSMATSVLPGVGPMVAFAYSAIPNRNGETWDRINKYVIPFGEPTEDVREYFTPMFLRRISQGLLEDTAGEGFSRLLFGDPNQSDVYKMMVNRVFMAELSTGNYESNEQALKQAMQVAQDKANALWFLRGLTQFFAPAAPIAEYYYKTNKELVPLGVLLEGIRNVQNEVRKNNGTFDDQIDAIMKSFGDDVLPYLASVSETQVPGSEASQAFYDFKTNNEQLFQKYPDVAGYFGPNTNEFDQEIYNIQRRAGQVKAKNVEDVSAEIQQLWGNLRFNRIKDQLEAVYGTSPAASMGKSILEAQIQQDFPLWNRRLAYEEYADRIKRNVNEVLKAVEDPEIQALPSYPTIQRYLKFRELKSQEITSKFRLSTLESWKTNKGGIYDREVLKAFGDALATEDPSFAPLWNNVLSKEFRTLTPQEMRLAQAGQLP